MNVKIIFDSVDIIDGIKDSFSVHVSMEEDVFSARVVNLEPSPEMLNGKADAIINTASGEIASFPDGADGVPMKSMVVTMQPIQDLHGYSSPWPAGGGKNKYSGGDIALGGSNPRTKSINIDTIPAGTYYFSVTYGGTSASGYGIQFLNANNNNIGERSSNGTLTLTGDAVKVFAYMSSSAYSDGKTANFSNIQVELGSTATAYEPYSNICPISGRTGLSVYRTGKNLFPTASVNLGKPNSRTQNIILSEPIPAGSYVFSYVRGGTYTGTVFGIEAYNGNTSIGNVNANNGKITLSDTATRFYIYLGTTPYNNDETITFSNCQLELGSTATTYEPYNGNTYAVDWTSQAGTVYHGTVDPVTGQLTVTRVSVDLGTLNFSAWNRNANRDCFSTGVPIRNKTSSSENIPALSSIFTPSNFDATWKPWDMSYTNTNGQVVFMTPHELYVNGTEFKTAMSGVQFVYELATPITYQLSPQEVETLKGKNHVWSDAGDVDLTYVADTKLYIDNKIAQAIAAALNA